MKRVLQPELELFQRRSLPAEPSLRMDACRVDLFFTVNCQLSTVNFF
jgi:hypothetical protein